MILCRQRILPAGEVCNLIYEYFYSINTEGELSNSDFKSSFNAVLANEIKGDAEPYKIVFLNGTYPNLTYRFKDFKLTQMNSVLSVKMFDKPQNGMQGLLMYDVNGSAGPNIWGKDVFGFNIYADRFEPFVKSRLSVFRNKIVPKWHRPLLFKLLSNWREF